MTEAEQKAADAAKLAADAAKAEAEAEAKRKADENKKWDNSEVQKIISERQEAKEKLRKLEDAENKRQDKVKKEADEKAIAEGKMKDVLEQREKELAEKTKALEAYNAKEKLRREEALNKITDPDMKALAEKLNDADDVVRFVDKVMNDKTQPWNKKGQAHNAADPENELKPKAGETYQDYDRRLEEFRKKKFWGAKK